MKPPYRVAFLVLMGSLVGLSGCVWPDGGGYRDRGAVQEQRRGGDNNGGQDQRRRDCDQQRQGDCHNQEHQ
ncbi:MAG TPA: hypothetical protein VND80_00680 [Steroidobacteraceae bacterium]|nr:hypothetical protein [Steroidobacteraceae bacterium]